MRDPLRLGKQRGQYPELRLGQTEGTNPLLHHGGHAATDVQQQAGQHDRRNGCLGHPRPQTPKVCLQHVKLRGGLIIH